MQNTIILPVNDFWAPVPTEPLAVSETASGSSGWQADDGVLRSRMPVCAKHARALCDRDHAETGLHMDEGIGMLAGNLRRERILESSGRPRLEQIGMAHFFVKGTLVESGPPTPGPRSASLHQVDQSSTGASVAVERRLTSRQWKPTPGASSSARTLCMP